MLQLKYPKLIKKKKILHLNLYRKYFDDIADGKKVIEYRDITPYWTSRLHNKIYDYKSKNVVENTYLSLFYAYNLCINNHCKAILTLPINKKDIARTHK